jgi:hypothetical protein
MTKRDRQAAEYAADQEGAVSDDSNKRWRVCLTNRVNDSGVALYSLVGYEEPHNGQPWVRCEGYLERADGWHATEAAALRDAAAKVAEIHAAIGVQLARLLRGER